MPSIRSVSGRPHAMSSKASEPGELTIVLDGYVTVWLFHAYRGDRFSLNLRTVCYRSSSSKSERVRFHASIQETDVWSVNASLLRIKALVPEWSRAASHVKYRMALISIACRYEGCALFFARTHIARGRAGICAGPSHCSRVVVPPERGAACELLVQACVGAGRCLQYVAAGASEHSCTDRQSA